MSDVLSDYADIFIRKAVLFDRTTNVWSKNNTYIGNSRTVISRSQFISILDFMPTEIRYSHYERVQINQHLIVLGGY